MVNWLNTARVSPIGLDIDSRSVRLVQLTADRKELVETSRWDYRSTSADPDEDSTDQLLQALRSARESRTFRGKDVVLCLNHKDLFLQNIRVPRTDEETIRQAVMQEAAGRIPFAMDESEIRYLESADVRQGEAVMREIILLACHRPILTKILDTVEEAGFRPIAVDVEPCAVLRSYASQYRREDDMQQRGLIVHVGNTSTSVVIAQGDEPLFIKSLDVGGRQLDQAVADFLEMNISDAHALRKSTGDRREDKQDQEVAQTIAEATRPVMDTLMSELSMCIRYHSVTFRGKPLVRLVLGGEESSPQILEALHDRLDLECELSNPFRGMQKATLGSRQGQWDVALGLALRTMA